MNSSATANVVIPIVPEHRQGEVPQRHGDGLVDDRSRGTLDARIERLKTRLAPLLSDDSASDWGNFGNNWGQGGGFDNFNNFQNGY